jgi:hypothetical protein
MARLQYDPIAAPSTGNGAFAVNDAARNVSAGLTALGTGLTELGSRREKRIEAENAKREAQVANTIKMYAEMAPDEAALQSLMQDVTSYMTKPGAVGGSPNFMDKLLGGASPQMPVGASTDVASIFGSRRDNLLSNETTRATNRGIDADTEGQLTENALKSLELEDKNLENAWNKEFGADLNKAAQLAAEGKIDEARAIEGDVINRAGDRYGARPDEFFKRSYELLTAGDDARSGVIENDLTLQEKRADIAFTKVQTANAIAQEEDRNRLEDYTFGRTVRQDDREWKQLMSDDGAKEYLAKTLRNSGSLEEALNAIDKEPSLDDRQKTLVANELNKEYSANPNLFDLYNPTSDKTRKELMGFSDDEAKQAPQASSRSLTSIRSRASQINQIDPSLGLFNRAENLAQEFGDLNGNIRDFPARVAELFPEKKVPDWLQNDIAEIQAGVKNGHRPLTQPEMLAIIEQSFGKKKTGFLGLGAEERQLSRKNLRDTAKAYASQDTSTLAVRAGEIGKLVSASNKLGADITRMNAELSRAIDDGNDKKVADLRAKILLAETELMANDVSLGEAIDKGDASKTAAGKKAAAKTAEGDRIMARREAEAEVFDKLGNIKIGSNTINDILNDANDTTTELNKKYVPVL